MMKKLMAILALSLLGGSMTAQAVPVFKTFDVIATDFTLSFGSGIPTPVSPLTINFSVSFDNSADVLATTTGLTINNFNASYAAEFAYDSSSDKLVLATSATISALGITCGNLQNSFCIFIDDISTASPNLKSVQQVTSSGEIWFADTINVTSSSVPEPATLALMGLGLAGIGYTRRRSMKAA